MQIGRPSKKKKLETMRKMAISRVGQGPAWTPDTCSSLGCGPQWPSRAARTMTESAQMRYTPEHLMELRRPRGLLSFFVAPPLRICIKHAHYRLFIPSLFSAPFPLPSFGDAVAVLSWEGIGWIGFRWSCTLIRFVHHKKRLSVAGVAGKRMPTFCSCFILFSQETC